MNPFGTGAVESRKDSRNFKHPTTLAVPLPSSGGYNYKSSDILHQHKVGICTAISLVQNAQKVFGKKYSPDFQYLLQKKFVDGNWDEGSAISSALKVGRKYGFLPIELFPFVTEADRQLPYDQYIAKLKAIPSSTIQTLLAQCTDKVVAYASVDLDQASLQKAIINSEAGILCRMSIDQNWWVPSWNEKDINPLRAPTTKDVTGHAINWVLFNSNDFLVANTWGTEWDKLGCADIILDNYQPTEAWIPYYNNIPSDIKANLQYQQTLMGQVVDFLKQLKDLISSYV